jgi:hypothetical protein
MRFTAVGPIQPIAAYKSASKPAVVRKSMH